MKRDEDIFIRFYIKCTQYVCRITVKKVLLKATRIEKHTKTDKQDHIINQHEQITDVRMIEGYLIIG